MKINDISKPITAHALNESLAKKFGQRIDIDRFTLEQLQDARNKVRTKLSQVETTESFNQVHSETYQKSKMFLDVLNAAISEREHVTEKAKPDYLDLDKDGNKKEPMKKAAKDAKKSKKKVDEKAVSQDQQQAAGIALKHKREGTKPQKGSASEEMMKMSTKELEKFAGTKHKGLPNKKTSEAAPFKSNIDPYAPRPAAKGFTRGMSPEFEVDGWKYYADVQDYGDVEKVMHYAVSPDDMEYGIKSRSNSVMSSEDFKKWIDSQTDESIEEFDRVPPEDHNDLDYEGGMAQKQLVTINDAARELADCLKADENLPEWVQKKIILAKDYIDSARDYLKSAKKVDKMRSFESVIREGAEDQAEIVMAAKGMVDKITSWLEDTAEMQTESMLELADAIRDEMGSEQSESFVATVKPALETLYASMEETRATLTNGVGMLTGEAEAPDTMGAEEPEMEPTVDAEAGAEVPAEEPADDEFAAAAPAAGGEEEAGRARRESIERSRRVANILTSKKK